MGGIVAEERHRRLETAYPLAVGRAWRQLALGDDVSLVDAHEEP